MDLLGITYEHDGIVVCTAQFIKIELNDDVPLFNAVLLNNWGGKLFFVYCFCSTDGIKLNFMANNKIKSCDFKIK